MSEQLSLEALELATAALAQGLVEHSQYPQLLTVRDGVIQRFEITMDVSRQLVIRVLREIFGMEEAVARKDTFREAAKLGLIADAEGWIGHVNARNRTSHTYDSEIAAQVFAHIPSFLPDARDLLQRLKKHVA